MLLFEVEEEHAIEAATFSLYGEMINSRYKDYYLNELHTGDMDMVSLGRGPIRRVMEQLRGSYV
jgi:hypothetical protein